MTIDGFYSTEEIDVSEQFGAPGMTATSECASGLVEVDVDPSGRKYASTFNNQSIFAETPFGVIKLAEQYDIYQSQFKLQYAFTIESGPTMSDVNHAFRLIDGQDLFDGTARVFLQVDNTTFNYIPGTGTYSFQTPQMINI